MRSPSRLSRVALAAVSLLLATASADLLLQLWLGERAPAWMSVGASSAPEGLYLQSRALATATRPNHSTRTRSGVPIHTDHLGLRVAARDPARSTSGWLVLGDSFTAAIQVPAEQSFVHRLETRLGRPMHNAGVDGYSTWAASHRAGQLLPKLALEGMLLVFYTGNDFDENANWQAQSRVRSHAVDGRAFPVGPDRFAAIRWLLHRSILANLAMGTWEARTGPSPGLDSSPGRQLRIFHSSGEGLLRQTRRPTERALRSLRDQATSAQVPLVLAIAPPAYQIRPDTTASTFARYGLDPATPRLDAPAGMAQRIATTLRIPTCDLAPALRQAEADHRDPYFLFDGHWSPTGHEAVSASLASCLDRLGVLAGASDRSGGSAPPGRAPAPGGDRPR